MDNWLEILGTNNLLRIPVAGIDKTVWKNELASRLPVDSFYREYIKISSSRDKFQVKSTILIEEKSAT